MSELNNLSDIKENFDTIKSLLNSIRAQDVLNAGDMSKLLNVINGKLDKIDQEDNLELMNSALSSMKQSLDERHSVLISKFSTIESLFSNILKNSVDSLKSSEIKELFDIIATNLSVFSREVVSQKDTLTDIILRIEALREDDGSTGTIVSNLDVLKRELERFNNGFESIIVNLGDNFGTIVRALDDIRAKASDNHYDKDFENLYMTSNSILASIQVLDKKSVQMEETLANVLAKCESKNTEERLSELFLQNKEIYNSIGELAVNCNVEPLYQKIDNASALISSLKDILQNVDTDATNEYISKLVKIEGAINKVIDENDFGKVRADLQGALNQIANTVSISQNDLYVIKNDLETVSSSIKALDIHINFQNIQSSLTKSEVNIKTYISDLSNKFSQLSELTFQRTVEDIKQKVDALASEIKTTAGENIEALSGSLIGLKSSITDIETASGAANNLLFKNVSERLGALENTLAGLLNNQSISLSATGKQLTELSGNVNLKLDSISAEFLSTKEGFEELKNQVNNILGLDLQAAFDTLKSGIISVQSDLSAGLKNTLSTASAEQFEKINGEFEAAKQQLEECNTNLTSIYKDGLSELRSLLNGITSSLIDIVSYVSVTDNKNSNIELEKRFTDIEYALKDYSSDSVEKVNNFIKESLDKINTRLTNYDATTQSHFQNLASKIENNSTFVREDIKKSYEELTALKNEIIEFKEYVIEDLNNNPMKAELIDRVSGVKNTISDKLAEFEQKYAQNSQARWEEIQTLNNNIIKKIESIPEINRSVLTDIRSDLVNNINDSVDHCMNKAIDEIKAFVELSTGAHSTELDAFKDECSKIIVQFKNEIPNIAEVINLDDKLENLQDRISSEFSREFEKSLNEIISALKNKIPETAEPEDKEAMLDMLFSQEKKIKSDLAVEIENISKKIADIAAQGNSNKADIINRLGELEAGITRALERNELSQSEITEKLELFGNTLFKLTNSGGVSVNDAVIKIDELAQKINSLSGSANSQDALIDKIEELSLDVTKLISHESAVKNGVILAELLEKTEKSSTALFNAVQQLSVNNAKYASDINDTLTVINSGINAKNRSDSEKLFEELQAIKNALNSQLSAIESVSAVCSSLADEAKKDEISKLLFDFKSEIVTQMITIFNQISFSTEQDEIINFIRQQQEELKKTVASLSSSVDSVSAGSNKVIEELNNKTESLSAQILSIKDNINAVSGSENNDRYTLLNVEADLTKLRLGLGNLRDGVASASKLAEIGDAVTALGNSINLLRTELPAETIEYLRSQIDKLAESVQFNDSIASNIVNIKEKLESIDAAREMFRADVERAFNSVISSIEKVSDFKSLRETLKSSLDNLYNDLSAKIDSNAQNADLNAMLAAVITKQDANLAHIIAHIGTINNLDVLTKQDETTDRIISHLENNVQSKQDRNFEQIIARLDLINSIDAVTAQEEGTERIMARLDEINNKDVLTRQDENFTRIIEKLDSISDADVLARQDEKFKLLAARLDRLDNTDILVKQGDNIELIAARLDKINNADVVALLNTLKAEIITQLINTFNQISFAAETIELKTGIEEAHEDLKGAITNVADTVNKIASTQSEIVEDYTNAINRIEDSIENNHVFQLKAISEVAVNTKEFAERFASENKVDKELLSDIFANGKGIADAVDLIKAQLKALQESDEDSTHYSLSDIEEDLTKLRLIVSEIKENQNRRELETVIKSIDTVINQIQDLKEFIPVDRITDINEDTSEILDLLEGLALEIKNLHSTQDDIIGYVQDNEKSVVSEVKASEASIKSDVQMSLADFANEIKEFGSDTLSSKLSAVKNDIITQLLGVVSQISFVEEQEEIISRIDDVNAQINILSSGSPDTIGTYSLQDIETDVARLRVTLEEIKSQGRGEEIDDLVKNLASATQTLEYLKTEIPNHEISEVREELEKIANDIISISIRTNKLLISSDESYKNLKENIEDFRNIMGGVDERTKNLYEEVGMDKIESQVTSIRDIVGRQELTNKVFNEVFEYLAEWVDSTGEKIGYITDKLNNTEDINEIKLTLEDLKNSTSVKFEIDAQSDKIDAMESKLNVIIESLEPTFQNQQERMQSLERKVNRIVDFFEPAFTKQQERINKLETMLDKILDVVSSGGYDEAVNKLDKISDIIASKDDTQLVKKITSFERQISKLNKSVEKLTSYVDEK